MAYTRFWFKKDKYAITLGGGQMNKPRPLPNAAAAD
jgi:hypothetical protein